MNRYEIYISEKIQVDDKEITDPKEIGLIIKRQISHLGDISIYWKPTINQETGWRKWLRLFGSGY